MKYNERPKTICSVGGGKGGVGKSIFSVALGTVLAESGRQVVLADLDLGAANLHACLGIIKKTPTLADFILKKAPSLQDILIETSRENLKLISGAECIPGMANPAHWMKLKMMRHIRHLPADIVILDLGAGIHYNTLDFFGMSDSGIVITAPEPGAVMNAYGFIKGALFRKLQNVFRRHAEVAPIIDVEIKKTGEDHGFNLEQFAKQVNTISPEMTPLIEEIERSYSPALVVNRVPEGKEHVLVKNLISLCSDKLGVMIEHIGNLPDCREITHHLLNIPGFLYTSYGRPYRRAVEHIIGKLDSWNRTVKEDSGIKTDFSDEDIDEILDIMEGLDEGVFSGTSKDAWKLRLYFKPSEVVHFLVSRGVKNELFYSE